MPKPNAEFSWKRHSSVSHHPRKLENTPSDWTKYVKQFNEFLIKTQCFYKNLKEQKLIIFPQVLLDAKHHLKVGKCDPMMEGGYGQGGYRRRRETLDELNAEFDAVMAEIAENDDDAFTGLLKFYSNFLVYSSLLIKQYL